MNDFEVYRAAGRVGPDSVVLDLGGHVGSFAIPAHDAGAHVTVVEPLEENRQVLERARPTLPVLRAAAGAKTGLMNMQITTTSGSFLSKTGTYEVLCCSLEHLVELVGGHVDFLKSNIEGAEYEVIEVAPRETLEAIDFLAISYHAWTVRDEPRREGVGHREGGPSMPPGEPYRMINKLWETHTVEVVGDDAGGLVFAERET